MQAMHDIVPGHAQDCKAWHGLCRRHVEDLNEAAAKHAEADSLLQEQQPDAGTEHPTSMPAAELGRPATPCYLRMRVP